MSMNTQSKFGYGLKDAELQITSKPVGGLSTYIEHQSAIGVPAIHSNNGLQGWVPGVRGEIMRLPLHCTDHVPKELLRRIFKTKNAFIASYLLEPDRKHPPNCFHYIARDKNYSLKHLSKNTRSKIRRGLKNLTVRPSSWNEIKEKGFPAFKDTDARHGYSEPGPDTLDRIVERREGSSNYHQAWGAWDGDHLAAWIDWIRVDNWAIIGLAYSQTKYLRKYPNNALIYAATRYFLNKDQCAYVSHGVSSVQARSNTLVSLHTFKRQMGFEAVPFHRHFVPRTFLRPIITYKTCSILWETMATLVPQSSAIRKIAGMARLISGREKTPLAWAEGLE